jgi:hypothetical protein
MGEYKKKIKKKRIKKKERTKGIQSFFIDKTKACKVDQPTLYVLSF